MPLYAAEMRKRSLSFTRISPRSSSVSETARHSIQTQQGEYNSGKTVHEVVNSKRDATRLLKEFTLKDSRSKEKYDR